MRHYNVRSTPNTNNEDQRTREFRWLANNLLDAKKPEDRLKFEQKLKNWAKANPACVPAARERALKLKHENIADLLINH